MSLRSSPARQPKRRFQRFVMIVLGSGFLSCFGFLVFLSFFWLWFPLPMAMLPFAKASEPMMVTSYRWL